MTTISELSHLLAAVRLTAPQPSNRSQKQASISSPVRTEKPARLSRQELKQLIRKRLLALDLADEVPSFEQTITSFVEAVLVWEFGDDILQSKNTLRTIKETVRRCSENSTLKTQMQTLFGELQSSKQ